MIILAGTARVDKSRVNEFLFDAKQSGVAARQADGNQSFFCAIADAEVGSVLFYERWRDQAALEAYLSRPEVQAIFVKWGSSMINEVRKFDAENERDPVES